MQAWQTALLTALLSVLTAIITTKVTAWSSHKNEIKKWILEKRAEIYFSFYDQVELALMDRENVFKQSYLDSLAEWKPKIKLISSKKTFEAFRSYYEFIRNIVFDYKNFCFQNDPEAKPNNFHRIISENGDESYDCDIIDDDIEIFKRLEKQYKLNHRPDSNTMNLYIEPLYQSMRRDLGSNV